MPNPALPITTIASPTGPVRRGVDPGQDAHIREGEDGHEHYDAHYENRKAEAVVTSCLRGGGHDLI